MSLRTARSAFFDAAGKPFLTQAAESITPVQVGGKPFFAIKEGFNYGTKEAFYGLGQHQNAQTNSTARGRPAAAAQHDRAVPFVVSDKNYGLLWDNNGITRFGDPKPYALAVARPEADRRAGKAGGLTARY